VDISPGRTDSRWTTRVENRCYHPRQVVEEGTDGREEEVVERDEERFEQVVGGWTEQTAGHHPQHLVGCY